MAQLLLDLPIRAALGRHDFVVAPCNAEAVALIDNWDKQKERVHWVYGAAGCGKSHLAAVLAQTRDTQIVSVAEMAKHSAVQACLQDETSPATLVLDGLDMLSAQDEDILFHLLNAVQHSERGRRLLLLSVAAPNHLEIELADLRSRLLAIGSIAMRAPDDDLLGRLLQKLFADRQIKIDEKIITYLLPRITRDYGAMRDLVASIDKAALEKKREITIPLIASVLEEAGL